MTVSDVSAPPALPRLLAAKGVGLAEHFSTFGQMGDVATTLIDSLDRAGLTGRGGAAFPTGRKMAAVSGSRPVVVANGAEGEPLSRKDASLLARAPHLVLDGLDAAARAVGAETVYLYAPRRVMPVVARALGERRGAGLDRCTVNVVESLDTFVGGEESAVLRRIEGGPALPRDRKVLTAISGLHGRSTLVNNVETLAHIALIARFGPRWFRAVGDPADPGSMLVTLSGGQKPRGLVEVPTGVLLTELLNAYTATDPRAVQAVLVGGYHGSWVPFDKVGGIRVTGAPSDPSAVTRGAGIVHTLAHDECGLVHTARIVAYLAGQSAGQCGPCLNGLPRLAELLDDLAYTRAGDALIKDIYRMTRIINGRGACRHPDGTARMVRSALSAFATDIEHHLYGRCEAALVSVPETRHHLPRYGTRTM